MPRARSRICSSPSRVVLVAHFPATGSSNILPSGNGEDSSILPSLKKLNNMEVLMKYLWCQSCFVTAWLCMEVTVFRRQEGLAHTVVLNKPDVN